MVFQVGDVVVHGAYGPGEIIELEKKILSGRSALYYAVQVGDMTVWVPADTDGPTSLRMPTPVPEFDGLFEILRSPGEPLSPDRFERKTQLMEMLKDGSLASICRVIRDLTAYSRTKKMNDSDNSILERARRFLLSEWKLCLEVPQNVAEGKLKILLGDSK